MKMRSVSQTSLQSLKFNYLLKISESDPLVNQPMENGALQNGVCFDKYLFHHEMLQKEPVKAMLRLHSFLVQDMLTYWGPCFVFHLLQERISFDLECLCKLNFTESPGSIYNIKNLFKFSFTNCPSFLSDKANEISYMPEGKDFDYFVYFIYFLKWFKY